jgi:hypothetical protein
MMMMIALNMAHSRAIEGPVQLKADGEQ